MMNRNGIGTLMRRGPAPGRGGISHLSRGEMVVPREAMQRDPGLRQHAMRSMAMQGRSPGMYMVGGRGNNVNPRTGRPEFADLVYTDQGWIDASTGQAPVYNDNTFANTGIYDSAPSSPFSGGGYSSQGYSGADVARSVGLDPSVAQGHGSQQDIDRFLAASGSYVKQAVAPDAYDRAMQNPDQALDFAPGSSTPYTVGDSRRRDAFGPGGNAGLFGIDPSTANKFPDNAGQIQAQDAPPPSPTFAQWQGAQVPSKTHQNSFFGQAVPGGTSMGFQQTPQLGANVLGGQMAVSSTPWGTPNTALGFGRENAANDPSILRSGYNNGAAPTGFGGGNIGQFLAGLFGGGNQNGGITGIGSAFGGPQPGAGPGSSGGGFDSSFRY